MVEPTRIVLPDGPHVPPDHPVALADLEFGRQHYLTHQRVDVLTGVHPFDRLVVDGHHGVAQPGQLPLDALFSDDRAEMTGEQRLGAQRAHPIDRLHHRQRIPIAVAAHGHQIRDMPEQASEHVAAQADTLVRQPHDKAVERLAAGCGIQLQAAATQLDDTAVFDDDRRGRDTLRGQRTESLRRTPDRVHHLVDPREGGVLRPECRQQVIVALPRRPIRLGDNLTVRVGDRADAADMVDVALREDDVTDGRSIDGVVVGAVHRSFEAHPRVQHDPAFVGRQHVRVRQAGRHPDAWAHLFRGRTRPDDVIGPRAAEVGGFVAGHTSSFTSKRSK